ncbi:unnamed protein product [Cyclocybe aegerita]|uniref:DUF6534 domain-containing protein n=1 Tax=Cyclocybe aegerita TaxID=1973307 RepID=A0A8S0WZ67_CYCAE|nr:unnamed protein product [Cyclocybe aegerita]
MSLISCDPLIYQNIQNDVRPTSRLAFLSVIGSASLWAMGMNLTFQFFVRSHYKESRPLLSFLVIWVVIMDTVRQAFTIRDMTVGDNAAQWIVAMSTIPLCGSIFFGSAAIYFFSALVSIPTQSLFIYRAWAFSGRKRWIPIISAPFLLFQLVFPIVLWHLESCKHRQSCNLLSYYHILRDIFIASCASSALIDGVTSVSLTFLLWKRYLARESLGSTNSILLRLMLLSANTGMWTAIVAVFLIIELLIAVPNNIFPIPGCYQLLSPLYFVTVLVNLNSRRFVRDAANRAKNQFSSIRLDLRNANFNRPATSGVASALHYNFPSRFLTENEHRNLRERTSSISNL